MAPIYTVVPEGTSPAMQHPGIELVNPDGSPYTGGSGAVSSVNTRTGAVTGLAEASDLTAEATTARSAEAAKAMGLTPTAVKTADYSAAAGDFVPVDTTSNAVTVTLPTAPADKTRVALKHIIQGGTNTVTYACGGSDVLNKTGGATTGTLTLLSQAAVLQYKASGAIWYIQSADVPLAQLDLRFAPIANSALIAALHPYEVGYYYDAVAGAVGNATFDAQNRTTAVPVYLRAGTLDRLVVAVNSGITSSVVRLGIWNVSTGGLPSSLLLDAGTVDTSTGGDKEKTISQVIATAGWYWLSATTQGGASSPSMKVITPTPTTQMPMPQPSVGASATPRFGLRDGNNWSGALGGTFGSPTNDVVNVPRIQYRYSV